VEEVLDVVGLVELEPFVLLVGTIELELLMLELTAEVVEVDGLVEVVGFEVLVAVVELEAFVLELTTEALLDELDLVVEDEPELVLQGGRVTVLLKS